MNNKSDLNNNENNKSSCCGGGCDCSNSDEQQENNTFSCCSISNDNNVQNEMVVEELKRNRFREYAFATLIATSAIFLSKVALKYFYSNK